MIVDKSFDVLLLGQSYLSTLYSCALQARGKKVLHIEDERITFGHNSTQCVGELEKNFLKLWGDQEHLAPMSQIERYLTPITSYFFINNKQMALSTDAGKNVQELWRKFPQFFSPKLQKERQSLAHELMVISEKWPSAVFHGPNPKKKVMPGWPFEPQQFPLFFELMAGLKSWESTATKAARALGDYPEEAQLLYALASTYLCRLSDVAQGATLAYLLLSALTPRYELDSERFTADLRAVFAQKGGQGKKTVISDWQIYQKRPISVLLQSFEGIVHPKQVYIMGGPLHYVPFSLKSATEEEQGGPSGPAWEVRLEGVTRPPLFMQENSIFTISYPDLVGTDLPLLQGKYLGAKGGGVHTLLIFCPSAQEEMTSPSNRQAILVRVQALFNRWSRQHASSLVAAPMSWQELNLPVYWEQPSEQRPRRLSKISNPQRVHARFGPAQGPLLKSVGHWGLEHSNNLGTFSFLKQLREASQLQRQH